MSTSSDDAEEELLLLYLLMATKRKKRKLKQYMKRKQQARQAQRPSHDVDEEHVEEVPIPKGEQEDPLSLHTMNCEAERKHLETLKWVLATDNIKQENESQEIKQETGSENIQVKVEETDEENVDNAYGEASVSMNDMSTNTDNNFNMDFINYCSGDVYIQQETTE